MSRFRSLSLIAVLSLAPLALFGQATQQAGVKCKDGTMSSAAGRGACAKHGGVAGAAMADAKKDARAATKAAAAADEKTESKATKAAERKTAKTSAAAKKAAAAEKKEDATADKVASKTAVAPTGATAKCKDGSYSTSKNRRGACSRHGGVASWMATK
jgi:hypothetical protein